MNIRNKLIFGFSAIGLLFLTVIIGNAISPFRAGMDRKAYKVRFPTS